jgi:hypothetical protein
MELSSYNAFLDTIPRPNEWKLGTGLVGTSAAIREFAAGLSTIRSRLEQNSDDAHCVVVFREPGCARLDAGIQALMGLGHATRVVLKRAAPFYNEGLLFGVGPRKGAFESSGDAAVIVQGLE